MATLYIIKGPYAGQYLQLEDKHASAAISDKWAVDTTGKDFNHFEFPPISNQPPYPASLQKFLDEVSGIKPAAAAAAASAARRGYDDDDEDERRPVGRPTTTTTTKR